MIKIVNRRVPLDLLCVLLLITLWLLFFWRIFTPNAANQLSLKEGDFSGQFVAWAVYQAQRLGAGQLPIWNPYNNSGHPFLADTQSAVFYPPRLITLMLVNGLTKPTAGSMYNALQLEMAAHVLLGTLFMYALLRRLLTADLRAGCAGALIGALIFGYGGYLTGYPPLQLAVLEAGIWLPLMLLALHEAMRADRLDWRWIVAAGAALGISLHAGHPQTSLQAIYVSCAYLAYRSWQQKYSWRTFAAALITFGAIGGGLAAVQLLPGWVFSHQTARNANFTFDSQGNGFPLYDIAQFIVPGIVSVWSPLYFGVVGLALALLAVWRRVSGALFWCGCAAIALGLSFGHNTIIYDIFYLLIPGFSLFRGQERAAYTVAVCSAVLAGSGASYLLQQMPLAQNATQAKLPDRYQTVLRGTLGVTAIVALIFFMRWQLTESGAELDKLMLITLSLIVGGLLIGLLSLINNGRLTGHWPHLALIGLVAFELFTFNRQTILTDYDAVPALDRLKTPLIVQPAQADHDGVFRVDGQRGILENYGNIYGLMDIRGISPLRLDRYEKLLGLPAGRLWQLLAVRYVFTDNNALPIPSTVIATGSDPLGKINLHKLDDPIPFAHLVYRTWIAADDSGALNALGDPNIDLRQTVVLTADPKVALPVDTSNTGSAQVLDYAPESFTIKTSSATPTILDLSQMNDGGWQATLDGQPVPILSANLALMAIIVPTGDHVVQVRYQPLALTVGGMITGGMLILVSLGVIGLNGRRRVKSMLSK